MKKLPLYSSGILMLVFFCSFMGMKATRTLHQEAMTITGTVTESGMPLPGASVKISGTSTGTTTDAAGKYRIAASKGQTLLFEFIGMKSQKIKIKDQKIIHVQLEQDQMALNEVVVTGMGVTRDKKSMGYAMQQVPGKVAGIMIRGNASAPVGYLQKEEAPRHFDDTKRYAPIDKNDEDYGAFVENPFEAPKNAPLSTFSIDVDNASYTNIRRFLNNGQTVPRDAVRVEEMVNFFKYQYKQPKAQHPFAIYTEYSQAPWNEKHQLLRIGLQGKNLPTETLPASNLVFLIDVSGSMFGEHKLPLLKQALKVLVNELREQDRVSMVVYAGAAGLVLPPTSGADKATIIAALDQLHAGGSTAGGAGIELAYKTAQQHFIKGGNNRVILATDGDFNVGASSNESMEKLIEGKRQSGIFLTVLGFGMGNYKDSKMEILADKGNGNYAYIDNMQEANRFLGKEFKGSMFAIAKDVKIQIEFNPKEVAAYRLIGYENRKLRPEDFTNDKIDAGELGSGHTVTALYEIIPAGVKSSFLEETPKLKYSKIEISQTTFSNELATVKFRYKKPDGEKSTEMVEIIGNQNEALDKASPDFKFAAAVAWFGLKLRDSRLVPNKSASAIKKLATSGLANDTDGYRAEFIRLVESEGKLVAGTN